MACESEGDGRVAARSAASPPAPAPNWRAGCTRLLRQCRPAKSMSGAATAAGTESGSDLAIVLVTVPSRDAGQKLGRALVERQLAACVNIMPGGKGGRDSGGGG